LLSRGVKMRFVLLTCLLAFAVSCTTPTPDEETSGDTFQAGRYEEAYRLYSAAVERSPENPLLREKAELARSAILKRQIVAARDAERRGRLDLAVEELRAGIPYDRAGTVREEIERLEAEMQRVQADLADARKLAAEGRNREAGAILASISRYHPTYPAIGDLRERVSRAQATSRVQSTRAEAERLLGRARDEIADGHPGAALATLDAAGADVRRDATFSAEASRLRSRVADDLVRRAEGHRAAERPATALLLARAAAACAPGDRRGAQLAASLEPAVRDRYAIRIRLSSLEDATGGRVDPGIFTRLVISSFRSSPPCPWLDLAAGGGADLGARGVVTSLNVAVAPPQRVRKVHQYSEGVEQQVNPEYEWLEGKVANLEDRLLEAEKRLEEVEWELFYLERLEAQVTVLSGGRRRFGDYSEAAYYRVLSNSRTREATLRRVRDETARELAEQRQKLSETPLYVERELVGEATYEEETVGKLATARGTYAIEALREIPGFRTRTGDVEAEAAATDRVTAGLPEVGLKPDPKELPTDARLAREALRSLAGAFAEEIGRRAAGLRLGLIPDARQREREGDEAGALELYAAFALGTGGFFPLEQGNASMKLWERWGIEVSGDRLDVRGLKLD
jgi:hypothetical protein